MTDAHGLTTMLCDAPANVLRSNAPTVLHIHFSLTSQENKWLIINEPLTLSICMIPFLSWTKFGVWIKQLIMGSTHSSM